MFQTFSAAGLEKSKKDQRSTLTLAFRARQETLTFFAGAENVAINFPPARFRGSCVKSAQREWRRLLAALYRRERLLKVVSSCPLRLRHLFVAGERCDVETLEWAKASFGVPVLDHWWQTGEQMNDLL